MKFPVILPWRSHVTALIIKYFHEKIRHHGRGMTMNEIRANGCWIVRGMSAVGSYIWRRIVCRKLCSEVAEQRMADLPEDRLELGPPLMKCVVDYFGPFTIKWGRKRWRDKEFFLRVWLQEPFIWRPFPHLKQMPLLMHCNSSYAAGDLSVNYEATKEWTL